MSVLPKNKQFVFSIRNYIRDTSEIFSICSLVKISLTSLLCFSSSFFLFSNHSYLCNEKKITCWFKHMKFIFSWNKDALTREIFFPLEDKLHMFAPPCSILYLLHRYECFTRNRKLIFPIRNYIRDTSEIFSISSLVKISLTSFANVKYPLYII